MKAYSMIAAVLLAACATDDSDIVIPIGSQTALLSPECAASPKCVCGLPPEQRPAMLVTPQVILDMFPDTPKELYYECADKQKVQ